MVGYQSLNTYAVTKVTRAATDIGMDGWGSELGGDAPNLGKPSEVVMVTTFTV